ncbi:MAG: hypothetical protein RL180_968 [Pseudomonadota bacterium]|jgi:hypothetical protein
MTALVWNRVQSPLVALFMGLLLSSWFTPQGPVQVQQIDFWLIWLLCMAVLALPLTLLESALARRSQTSPLQALSALTREADVSPIWRGVGWLAVAGMALIAGGLVAQASQFAQLQLHVLGLTLPTLAVLPVIAVGAVVLALWSRLAMLLGVLCAVSAVELSTFALGAGQWAWTAVSWSEWALAVTLALVASGLGMGLYWQQALTRLPAERASPLALPVWAAQLVAGALFALSQGIRGDVAQALYAVALWCGAAYLMAMLRSQLQTRAVPVVLQVAVVASACAVWLLPFQPLIIMVAGVMGLLACLFYAIFSGWQMKVSHVRKALGFEQEWVYNLWRVVMRVLLPLAVVLALVGMVVHVFAV